MGPAAAALITTPDTPLGLVWLASILALLGLARSPRPIYWYVLGFCFGFALLVKHSGLLILPLVLLAMLSVPEIRNALRTFHPWLALALGGLIAAPHLVAEWRNGLQAPLFQLDHLLGRLPSGQGGYSMVLLERLGGLIGGQLGLLTPIVAAGVVVALWQRFKSDASKLLGLGLLVPLAATFLTLFFTHPEQNWASLGHPVAPVLAIVALKRRYGDKSLGVKNNR